MQFKLKNYTSYPLTMLILALAAALTVAGCMLLGYLFLPFASAVYASILLYEKKEKRILSFIIPILFFVLNFFINGIFSLECVSYVLIGILIYICVKHSVSKGETVFWITLLTFILFALSAILFSFEIMKSVGFDEILEFYTKVYTSFKDIISDFLTSKTVLNEKGIPVFAYNLTEAEMFVHEFIMLLIPISVLLAFLSTGITMKTFSFIVSRSSGDECGIHLWKFKTSNLIAYFYVIIAVICFFAVNDGTIFTYVLTTINTILAPIYAYIGAYVIYLFMISRGKSPSFAVLVIFAACVILSSFAIQLLAFFGVYFNVTSNKLSKKLK